MEAQHSKGHQDSCACAEQQARHCQQPLTLSKPAYQHPMATQEASGQQGETF
jgi:hypothetical protein